MKALLQYSICEHGMKLDFLPSKIHLSPMFTELNIMMINHVKWCVTCNYISRMKSYLVNCLPVCWIHWFLDIHFYVGQTSVRKSDWLIEESVAYLCTKGPTIERSTIPTDYLRPNMQCTETDTQKHNCQAKPISAALCIPLQLYLWDKDLGTKKLCWFKRWYQGNLREQRRS